MKIEKNFSARRKDFTESRFSELRTGITKKCTSARFYEISHGFVKSDMPMCKQHITPLYSDGLLYSRTVHPIAKTVCQNAYRLRCFHNKIRRIFMSIRNEIKSQIVRAGFTMQELVDRLADEYGWSNSVSNLSAKLQRASIRYKEVVELADVLGYDLIWKKRGNDR